MDNANAMDKIQQVVVIMMENRGFDHMLGWLYDNASSKDLHFIPEDSPRRFDGLDGVAATNTFGPGFKDQKAYPPVRGTSASPNGTPWNRVPDPRPHEEFQYVYKQLYSRDIPASGNGNNPGVPSSQQLRGFLADYATKVGYTPANESDAQKKAAALKILECYTPEQLKQISGLAKMGAVSDSWFSSIPTQTNCNRAFLGAGTSQGMVNNQWIDEFYPVEWNVETVWNKILKYKGASNEFWKVYFSEHWAGFRHCFTQDMYKRLYELDNGDDYFHPIAEFYKDAAAGELPAFTFIEPAWYLSEFSPETPNSYHPPSDVLEGEKLLSNIYAALTGATGNQKAKDKWRNTLLVVTFDEHGGTYDHVPPPSAFNPGNLGPPPKTPEYQFDFKAMGVRVPTILVSPRIRANTVFRSPKRGLNPVAYDHTSIIASILEWMKIKKVIVRTVPTWLMGQRVDAAPTFWDVVTLDDDEVRDDLPETLGDAPAYQAPAEMDPSLPLPEIDVPFFARGLMYMSRRACVGEDLQRTVDGILGRSRTWGDLKEEIARFKAKYAGTRDAIT